MKKEEFTEILDQFLRGGGGAYYFRLVYLGKTKTLTLPEQHFRKPFMVPLDNNFRLAVSRMTEASVPEQSGIKFIMLQYNFRKIPDILKAHGYELSGFTASSQGRKAVEASNREMAEKLWSLLKGDREIEFTQFLFERQDTSIKIDRDMLIRISHPSHDVPDLMFQMIDLASEQREICNMALSSLGEKRGDGEILLQNPLTLRIDYEKFLHDLFLRGKYHITNQHQSGCTVSSETGVFQIMGNSDSITIVPDPAFALSDVLILIDDPNGVNLSD